jgi:hypothetical protein
MSSNRDVDHDRAVTQEVLDGHHKVADGSTNSLGHETNWLGHELGSGAARIDELLLTGATMSQMAEARGAVKEHLRHLREEHGLPIIEEGGRWRFNRSALEE